MAGFGRCTQGDSRSRTEDNIHGQSGQLRTVGIDERLRLWEKAIHSHVSYKIHVKLMQYIHVYKHAIFWIIIIGYWTGAIGNNIILSITTTCNEKPDHIDTESIMK